MITNKRELYAVFHIDTGKCIGSYLIKHIAEKRRRNTVNPKVYEVVKMQEVDVKEGLDK